MTTSPTPPEAAPFGTWLSELAHTLPGLVAAYRPRGPLDPRTRERAILEITRARGGRMGRWVHGSWSAFVGDAPDDDVAAAVVEVARRSARDGMPVPPDDIARTVPSAAVGATRATVAGAHLAGRVCRAVEELPGLARRWPPAPVGVAGRALLALAAAPAAVPIGGMAAAMRVVVRTAPAVPVVEVPPGTDANLLAQLVAEAAPAYLANAAVRGAVLGLPFAVAVALRSGRTAATVRVGRGRVEVVNGVAPDAWVVVEGDVAPLLTAASGTLARELAGLRIRPT